MQRTECLRRGLHVHHPLSRRVRADPETKRVLAVALTGVISLDHAIAAAFQRRFPRFETLSAAAVASLPHVVILGGGFGGLAAARGLRYAPCRVTLLDQHNYHLFQPLLYQVATAWLSPAEIATPLREMFRTQANVRVLLGEVTGVDPVLRQIALGETRLAYDFLI